MNQLPSVPVPPTDLSAPHDASVVFLVICSVIMVIAVAYVARRAMRGDWMGVLFLAGGLLAGVLEPMLDYLGLLWFAADNVAIAVETFHRHVPLYVVMGYAFYFGGSSYIAYRAMLAGRGATWFWGFFAIDWVADLALQATGQALGLYQYYGPQPLMIFDVPAWWFTIDASMPVLCAGALFLMRDHLGGWRKLVVIPLVPGMYAALNAGAGWPVFAALNSGPSTLVVWLAGIATMVLALLYRQLMLNAVLRNQPVSAPLPVRDSARATVRAETVPTL
jgi:lipoprotein signal peptidase